MSMTSNQPGISTGNRMPSADSIVVTARAEGLCFGGKGFSGWWMVVEKSDEKLFEPGKKYVFLGIISEMQKGYSYVCTGKKKWSEKYNNWNFAIDDYHPSEEYTFHGMINYLVREAPNIGPSIARQIVERFGENTIRVIAEDPIRVSTLVRGLDSGKAASLQEWAQSESKVIELKRKLYGYELTPGLVNKIITHFGGDAERKIREDCFTLVAAKGIGFLTCCKIADAMGVAKDDPGRIRAGVTYALQFLCNQEGHTCIPQDVLVKYASEELLQLPASKIIAVMKQMISTGNLCTQRDDPAKWARNKELFQPPAPENPSEIPPVQEKKPEPVPEETIEEQEQVIFNEEGGTLEEEKEPEQFASKVPLYNMHLHLMLALDPIEELEESGESIEDYVHRMDKVFFRYTPEVLSISKDDSVHTLYHCTKFQERKNILYLVSKSCTGELELRRHELSEETELYEKQ